ncbi:MAG: C1 family peptidase [Armatimonadetes bacterium]|nr:C1 family peptidase [Armatimonadota bacterium]MDE2207532.1 C1 family peptidase [Armatimonadota bacterium]
MRGVLCPEDIAAFQKAFRSDPRYAAAMNSITKTSLRAVITRRAAVVRTNHTFSHMVKSGSSTSQNGSGRCWMFAGLNSFRMAAAAEMNLEEFEFSENYVMFWDKLEKANYFLENILKTLDEPTDSRLIAWLLGGPVQDGGQWDMFVSLVKKYGLVPKETMPESESSSSTGAVNDTVTYKLREYAAHMRAAHKKGAGVEALEQQKAKMLQEIYRMLVIHLGEPPQAFNWQWRDKDKTFHRDGMITPQEFMQRHVPVDLDAMVCLIHCPQASKKYNTLYTVKFLGNVVGGQLVRYLNVDIATLKKAALAQIKDERPVWFGCDVGKMLDRDLGLMDAELYDFESLYGIPFGMNKAMRLDYSQSAMSHAMVLTGADIDDAGKVRKWRVENSWGDKGGDKGYMVMTDEWFDEYLYEVAIDRKYLSSKVLKVLDSDPVELEPWDPMGSLAGAG